MLRVSLLVRSTVLTLTFHPAKSSVALGRTLLIDAAVLSIHKNCLLRPAERQTSHDCVNSEN